MSNILVTGTHGIIGKALVKKLKKEGCTITSIDKVDDSVGVDQHYTCNILDADAVTKVVQSTQPDALVHLAARTDLNETEDITGYAANIDGVQNVVDAVSRTPSIDRAIYTSSQLVCPLGYIPDNEYDYCPDTLYGESKVLTERIVRREDGGGVPWCIVRPTTVWGPHMKPHYKRMLKYIQNGVYFHVGKKELRKSYSYAGNIAHQYYQLLTGKEGKVNGRTLYLADYTPITLREYANAFQKELEARPIPTCPLPVARIIAKMGDVVEWLGWENFPFTSFRLQNILAEYVYDMNETQEVCGPLPYTFEEGIKETVEWYMQACEEK